MSSKQHPTYGVLQEVRNEETASTIRRRPVPSESNYDYEPTLPRRMDDLSLSTRDAQEIFVTSPTRTSSSTTSGDEFLGSETETETPEAATTKTAKLKTAFEDARHFAGGLISHPFESTKHFSILRHSHGLVYFKGFKTNVAITVFADQELPTDRQFWLQKRGLSGKTGMKVGALIGSKSAWINVTPTLDATAHSLPPTDERAWQRDIEKFLRKARKDVRNHRPRETNVIRIPAEAQDGYFRIVLCAGEKSKVLCPSPIFRLASTSTASSSIRGASLSTLPVEMGIKIGQLAGKTAALNAVAPVAGTVAASVKQMLPYQPSGVVKEVASTAIDVSKKTFEGTDDQYRHSRQSKIDQLTTEQLLSHEHDELARPRMIGDDPGPSAPFPFRFSSKVIPGSGSSRAIFGMPTANLATMPEEVRLRLSGTYMGWASIAPSKNLDMPSDVLSVWHQAIITIAPLPDSTASVVLRKDVRVYILADFDSLSFVSAVLSLIIMAPVRPLPLQPIDVESQLFSITQDIAITQASLSREAWSAEDTLSRIKTDKSNRSLTERLVDVRTAGQKQVDRVPVHRLGVRTDSLGVRDRLVGRGGVCVKR